MFVQHNRYKELNAEKNSQFSVRCLERPNDPGVIYKIPHIIQLMGKAWASPETLFAFNFTLTRTFCFVKDLHLRTHVQSNFSEADEYIFTNLVLKYLSGEFQAMYGRPKILISSALRHFPELAAKHEFKLMAALIHTNAGTVDGWRAVKWSND